MKINRNLLIKLLLFFISLVIVSPPINNWPKLIALSLITVVIFSSKIDLEILKKKIILLPLILLICIKFYSQSYSFIVNHIVLPTKPSENFNFIKDNFDKDFYVILENELKKLSNKEVLLKNIKQPGESSRSTQFKKFAFQVESIWASLDEGKYIQIKKDLNFWNLGPSALNDVDLNFGDNKKPEYQTNLIFPVLFKINFKKINNKSELCFDGNLILEQNGKYIKNFSNQKSCLYINYENNYYFLDHKRDLKLQIKKNFIFDNFNFIFLISLIFIFLITLKIHKKKNYFYLFITLSFYLILFLYFKFGLNPISGYSETIYFDRGMDGMAHYGFSRVILNNLFSGEIYNALKGTEKIFYYMPLMRYINSILMIFFGDNILGTIFLISFFPVLVFKTLDIFFTTKNSKIFTIIFLFIPLFEALGFTIINYISYTVDGYGEGLAYLLILYIVYLFLISDEGYLKYFLIGFCSFIIIGIRPNYIIFCFSLIFNYIVYLYIQKKEIPKYRFKIFFLFFGFAFILLIPIHNYIYGNEYILLVKTENVQNSYHVKLSDYSLLFKNFFQFNIDFNLLQKILNHLAHYIKIYELWFMIILLNLVFVLFTNHQIKLKILASNLLLMHGTFLFFLGDPRYSMGCWLISFIIFMFTYKSIYYSYFFYLKAKFFQQNNRLK